MKRSAWILGTLAIALAVARAGEPVVFERGAELIRTEFHVAATGLRAMSLAAHPDDEDGGTLAFIRREWGFETHLCQFTRGEGGQNESGPELGADLAVLRTAETEAACKILGAKAWYLNLPDFGYSKSVEETLKVWGHDVALERLVRIIRIVRPHVLFMNHDPEGTDHGHHRTAGRIAVEAFDAAADATKFPEQMKEDGTQPWSVSKLYSRRFAPVDATLTFNVANRNPATGLSASDIGALALLQHTSQGMQRNMKAGESDPRYFKLLKSRVKSAGKEIYMSDNLKEPELFLAPELNHGDEIPKDPASLVQMVLSTLNKHKTMDAGRRRHLERAVSEATGIVTEARVSDDRVTYDEDATVTARVVNRGELSVVFEEPTLVAESARWSFEALSKQDPVWVAKAAAEKGALRATLKPGESAEYAFKVRALDGAFPNDPPADYNGTRNEERPLLRAIYRMAVVIEQNETEQTVAVETPVPIRLSQPRAIVARPDPVLIFDNPDSKDDLLIQGRFRLAVTNYRKLTAPMDLFAGIVPANDAPVDRPAALNFSAEDETAAREFFFMAPVEKLDRGVEVKTTVWTAQTNFGGPVIHARRVPLRIPAPLHVAIVKTYDDATLLALKRMEQAGLGLTVAELSADDVLSADLNKYHTVLLDVRATQYRPEVRQARERLLQFMKDGGNVVCMYHKDFDWNDPAKGQAVRGAGFFKGRTGGGEIAPFPIELSFGRVTDETAEVRILNPEHPLMKSPNRIWKKDFEGWVQERSVYVPSKWDEKYTALLSSNDPGEKALDGGLLVADVGEGSFIYTGFVWYRQLRAGNPGAYRMLANMISYARLKRRER